MTDLERQHAALLANICRHPNDIDARLVLADFLEECGETGRSEFIRVQCELARHYARKPKSGLDLNTQPSYSQWLSDFRELQRRERSLLASLGVEALPTIDGLTRSNLNGRCGWMARSGVGEYTGIDAELRRGFVEQVTCTLALWQQHGAALVQCVPLLRVTLTDREPHAGQGTLRLAGGELWQPGWVMWVGEDYARTEQQRMPSGTILVFNPSSVIPATIYHHMDARYKTAWGYSYFPSRQAALDALSTALLMWARGEGR